MAYINTQNDLPGIQELFIYRPETGRPLSALAQAILRGPSSLSPQERELIAAFVSAQNDCNFCHRSHAAAAQALSPADNEVSYAIVHNDASGLSPRMQALLALATAVAQSGKAVTPEHIDAAKAAGATEQEIHDAVLVASAFCMFNRYVDGLGARTPDAPETYEMMGHLLATHGYVRP